MESYLKQEHLDYIKNRFEEAGFILNERQLEQFYIYYEMLAETNKVMNLTAITEFEEVVNKHFIDSIMPGLFMEFEDQKIVDLGTGAGFPGIPLKILYPGLKVTLADSLNKRLVFLNGVISSLGLHNIETVHIRAEEMGKNTLYREKFDLCVSRAVANLSTLSEYCLPLVHKDGYFISYKTQDVDKELEEAKKAIHLMGGKAEKLERFEIPGTDLGRSLIYIKKIQNTPKGYPRKSGLPGKEPIH